MPRSRVHGGLSGGGDSATKFAGSDYRGLVHWLRVVRAELPVRKYQPASVRGARGGFGKSGAEESSGAAEGDFVRLVHPFEGAELRVCMSTRRGAPRGSAKVFCGVDGAGAGAMRMDRIQRGWAVASLGILAVSSIAYVAYAHQAPGGARGGSVAGLAFG